MTSSSTSNLAVSLRGVTKRFGSQTAVNAVDLGIHDGSIHGIIGPNGSGKTTILRMILRIYRPDAGTVSVLGKDHGEAADDRVGYLPEERGLYHRMKVRDVLRYFARLKGHHRPDPDIDHWLEKLQATEWSHKRIEQLSKGMAQKIQFIAAVVANPKLVILDEPFSGLDPVNMEVLRDAVLELKRRGTTVLLSTHDMDVAEQMCDRIFMIYKGNKVLDGTLQEIQTEYGEPILRVKMAQAIAPDLQHSTLSQLIDSITTNGAYHDIRLKSSEGRYTVLKRLVEQGDVEHFETAKPTLHDIFIRIARPTAVVEE
jgi:ABC-2 type transport system ATP-binding protein